MLFDDFLTSYALWLWFPHRASRVRDDGGGLVCQQPRQPRTVRHCERSEAIPGTSV